MSLRYKVRLINFQGTKTCKTSALDKQALTPLNRIIGLYTSIYIIFFHQRGEISVRSSVISQDYLVMWVYRFSYYHTDQTNLGCPNSHMLFILKMKSPNIALRFSDLILKQQAFKINIIRALHVGLLVLWWDTNFANSAQLLQVDVIRACADDYIFFGGLAQLCKSICTSSNHFICMWYSILWYFCLQT